MAKIEEKVEKLIEYKINKLGYTLYDVEYVKEGKEYFLKVFIDNSKGITIEDCELVSNSITDILDKEDYIKEQYFLEVSSPGVERILRKNSHLEGNIGTKIQVKLFKPINGQKQYIGILKDFNEENIILEENLELSRKNIAQIKTMFDWK